MIFAGRQMRAVLVNPPWVFVEWLYPGDQKYTAFKELRQIEKKIQSMGLRGWYASSEKDHTVMHDFLRRFQAKQYGEDNHSLHFQKEVI